MPSKFDPNEVTLRCTVDNSRAQVRAVNQQGEVRTTRTFASANLIKQIGDKILACTTTGANFTLAISDAGNIVED